jgi:hypothetical protein
MNRDLLVFGLTLLVIVAVAFGLDSMERAIHRVMGWIVPPAWWQKEKKS